MLRFRIFQIFRICTLRAGDPYNLKQTKKTSRNIAWTDFKIFSKNFAQSWGFGKVELENNFSWNMIFFCVGGRKLPEFYDEIATKLYRKKI
jgi:hypothetical protein